MIAKTQIRTTSDRALVELYLNDYFSDQVGVDYHVAQEMERREFRDKDTKELTYKAIDMIKADHDLDAYYLQMTGVIEKNGEK